MGSNIMSDNDFSIRSRETEMLLIEEMLLSLLLQSLGEQRCKWKILDCAPFQNYAAAIFFDCFENRTGLLWQHPSILFLHVLFLYSKV